MKKNECLQKEVHDLPIDESLLNTADNRATSGTSGKFRKLFYLTSLACIGLFFNGCVAGYVETEPSYMVINRPPQPSNVHVWIDGGWGWNNRSHGYVQRPGYWDKPRQGQTYVPGHWQSSPKGKYWQNGSWQKQNNQNGKYRK